MSSDLRNRLFEAHVAFELARFQDDRLQQRIETEIGALYDHAAGLSVESFLPREVLRPALLARLTENREPPPEIAAFLQTCAEKLLASLQQREETGADLLSREAYDLLVQDFSADENMRNAALHGTLNNAVFSLLISEILYTGITEFMTESRVAKNLPGMQAMLKFGTSLLNQAAPGLTETMGKSIKEFIRDNAGGIVRSSETVLHKSLTTETIREAADQLWNDIAARRVNETTRFLSGSGKLDRYRQAAVTALEHFRRTDFFREHAGLLIDVFYDRYGKTGVAKLIEDAGLDRQRILEDLREPAGHALRSLRDSGYLESVIRRNLSEFYESDAARGITD